MQNHSVRGLLCSCGCKNTIDGYSVTIQCGGKTDPLPMSSNAKNKTATRSRNRRASSGKIEPTSPNHDLLSINPNKYKTSNFSTNNFPKYPDGKSESKYRDYQSRSEDSSSDSSSSGNSNIQKSSQSVIKTRSKNILGNSEQNLSKAQSNSRTVLINSNNHLNYQQQSSINNQLAAKSKPTLSGASSDAPNVHPKTQAMPKSSQNTPKASQKPALRITNSILKYPKTDHPQNLPAPLPANVGYHYSQTSLTTVVSRLPDNSLGFSVLSELVLDGLQVTDSVDYCLQNGDIIREINTETVRDMGIERALRLLQNKQKRTYRLVLRMLYLMKLPRPRPSLVILRRFREIITKFRQTIYSPEKPIMAIFVTFL